MNDAVLSHDECVWYVHLGGQYIRSGHSRRRRFRDDDDGSAVNAPGEAKRQRRPLRGFGIAPGTVIAGWSRMPRSRNRDAWRRESTKSGADARNANKTGARWVVPSRVDPPSPPLNTSRDVAFVRQRSPPPPEPIVRCVQPKAAENHLAWHGSEIGGHHRRRKRSVGGRPAGR